MRGERSLGDLHLGMVGNLSFAISPALGVLFALSRAGPALALPWVFPAGPGKVRA